MSLSEKASLAGPFAASIFLVLLARPVTDLIIGRVICAIQSADRATRSTPGQVPPQVGPKYIADYIDYAADVAGNLSALVLAIVGLFLVIIGIPNYLPAIILAAVGFPLSMILIVRALGADPIAYNSRRRTRLQLSPSSALVLLMNAAGITLAFTK